MERREFTKKIKAVGTLEPPKVWLSRNVLENSGGESVQTAESGLGELWEEQIPSQVWVA